MNKKLTVLAAISFSVILSGCATISEPERSVINNAIFSTKYPKAVVQVTPEFEYIGMVPESHWRAYTSGAGGTTQTSNQFIFVSADENSIVESSLIVFPLEAQYWLLDWGL